MADEEMVGIHNYLFLLKNFPILFQKIAICVKTKFFSVSWMFFPEMHGNLTVYI